MRKLIQLGLSAEERTRATALLQLLSSHGG